MDNLNCPNSVPNVQISVDELEGSISVKISMEAVMSINSPDSLFTSVNGKLETKVYLAGLPNRTDNVIKPVSRWPESHCEMTRSGSKPVLCSACVCVCVLTH